MTKTKVTAEEIYNKLKYDFDLLNKVGHIEIDLGNISARYKGRDALGSLIQEWLSNWLESRNYYFRVKPNTQDFPDFLLSESENKDFLEIKTFNSDASPAFDVANFDSYCNSLLKNPERIDSDYLIFSYRMSNKGDFKIVDIWLKKVWEITSKSRKNPITIQVKKGMIYNLRPCNWRSKRVNPFKSKKEFLEALSETHSKYPQCDKYKEKWLKNISDKYLENTGSILY